MSKVSQPTKSDQNDPHVETNIRIMEEPPLGRRMGSFNNVSGAAITFLQRLEP